MWSVLEALTTLLFEFQQHMHKDDLRLDGYRWRQNGSKKLKYGSDVLHKTFFQVRCMCCALIYAYQEENIKNAIYDFPVFRVISLQVLSGVNNNFIVLLF